MNSSHRYRIRYYIEDRGERKIHYRYYNALDANNAHYMFKETCDSGSLTSAEVEIIDICERGKDKKWEKVSK